MQRIKILCNLDDVAEAWEILDNGHVFLDLLTLGPQLFWVILAFLQSKFFTRLLTRPPASPPPLFS